MILTVIISNSPLSVFSSLPFPVLLSSVSLCVSVVSSLVTKTHKKNRKRDVNLNPKKVASWGGFFLFRRENELKAVGSKVKGLFAGGA